MLFALVLLLFGALFGPFALDFHSARSENYNFLAQKEIKPKQLD